MTAAAEPGLTVSTLQPAQTAAISQDEKLKRKIEQRSLGERESVDGDATLVERVDVAIVAAAGGHHHHHNGTAKSGGVEVRASWAGLCIMGLLGLALGADS